MSNWEKKYSIYFQKMEENLWGKAQKTCPIHRV